MTPILFDLNHPQLADKLQRQLQAEAGQLNQRRFPDGEHYLQVLSPVKNRDTLVLCSLQQPDNLLLPLLFLAATLNELGARQVTLIAPYLAYMRQDKRFKPGECITSVWFARLISQHFDRLFTVDPHLHRYRSLDEIYSIPGQVVASAEAVADWIRQQVPQPLLIGPDSESEQWVADVAQRAGAPFEVLLKQRHGDRQVSVSVPHVDQYRQHTPVLLDDIISSGRTMLETLQHLQAAGMQKTVCIGSHGLFSEQSYRQLQQAHTAAVVTCNTLPHASNAIDISGLIARAVSTQA